MKNKMDRRTRILIIEDEPAMVAGLRDNFEYEGYEVISARATEWQASSAPWRMIPTWWCWT